MLKAGTLDYSKTIHQIGNIAGTGYYGYPLGLTVSFIGIPSTQPIIIYEFNLYLTTEQLNKVEEFKILDVKLDNLHLE